MTPGVALAGLLGVVAGFAVVKVGADFDQVALRWFLMAVVAGMAIGSAKRPRRRDAWLGGLAFASVVAAVCGFVWLQSGEPPWISGSQRSPAETIAVIVALWIATIPVVWLAARSGKLLVEFVKRLYEDVDESKLKSAVTKLRYLVAALGLVLFLLVVATGGADLENIPNRIGGVVD